MRRNLIQMFLEPAEPIFNVTSTLTSIRVEWLVVDDVDYYVIESDPLHFFAVSLRFLNARGLKIIMLYGNLAAHKHTTH